MNIIDLDKKKRESEIRKEIIKQTIPQEIVKSDKENEIINSDKLLNEENPNNTIDNINIERKSQINGLEENKLIEKRLSKARESIQKELESLKLTSQNLELISKESSQSKLKIKK